MGSWDNLKCLTRFARTYIRPRISRFAVVQLMHVVAVLLLLVPPLLIRYIIDRVVPEGNLSALLICSGSIVVVFGFFGVIAGLKTYWGHEVAQGITSRLRNDLYSHFQELSMSFHDHKKTGGLLARIVDDINVIQEIVHHGPEAIVLAVVMISTTAGLLFYLDWRLALVAMTVVPLLVIFAGKTSGRMWQQFREVRKRKASLSDVLEENLSGISIIKAFGSEDRERRAISEQNAGHYRSRMGAVKYVSVLFPGALFINNVGLAAVLVFGGAMAMGGAISVGTLTAFILYLGYLLHPIIRMVMMMEQGGQFLASMERFFDYMDIAPAIRDLPAARNLDRVQGEVKFEDVHFRYEDKSVLNGVTITAQPGQMIALVGPSGAGKTTIVRLIPRFYEPYQGRVLIDGRDLRDFTLRSLRSHIGMVMQDDFLFSGSVADNIAYGKPGAAAEEIVEAATLPNAATFIEQLSEGYDTEVGKRGLRLSEGQKQRVSIARAILKDPRILLLDEATSSVDPETELLIQKALDRLRRGRTTVAIAHRLSTIFRADQILCVEDGRIVERGNHHSLIEQDGEYARFFRIQFATLSAV